MPQGTSETHTGQALFCPRSGSGPGAAFRGMTQQRLPLAGGFQGSQVYGSSQVSAPQGQLQLLGGREGGRPCLLHRGWPKIALGPRHRKGIFWGGQGPKIPRLPPAGWWPIHTWIPQDGQEDLPMQDLRRGILQSPSQFGREISLGCSLACAERKGLVRAATWSGQKPGREAPLEDDCQDLPQGQPAAISCAGGPAEWPWQ